MGTGARPGRIREAIKAAAKIADDCAERRLPFPATKRLAASAGVSVTTMNLAVAALNDGGVFRVQQFHMRRRVVFPDGRSSL